MLALAFLPVVHVDELRHEGGPHKVEHWFPHHILVRLVHLDQDSRIASPRSHETLIQVPNHGGVKHAQLVLQVPGVGKWRLTRRRRFTLQLPVETVDGFFLQPCDMGHETGTPAKADQFGCFEDSGRLTAQVGITNRAGAWMPT